MQSDRMEIVQLCELTKIFLQVTKNAWMNTYSGIPYEEFPIRYEHLVLFDVIDVIMRNIKLFAIMKVSKCAQNNST